MVAVPFAATEASLKEGQRQSGGRVGLLAQQNELPSALVKGTSTTIRDNVLFISRDYIYLIYTP